MQVVSLLKVEKIRKAGNECLTSEAPSLGALRVERYNIRKHKLTWKYYTVFANRLSKWAQECDAHNTIVTITSRLEPELKCGVEHVTGEIWPQVMTLSTL